MRLVTWNCNGAFRRKYEAVHALDADVLVIQECENPAESSDLKYKSWAANYLWAGNKKHKGLAVFAKPAVALALLKWPDKYKDHAVKHFLPCRVNHAFNLLAVWAHQNNSPTFGYIGQVWKYVQTNKASLAGAIIAGDFNSNARWDVWDRWWNHSDVVAALKEIGLESMYHQMTGEPQGHESSPTLYFRRNRKSPTILIIFLARRKLCRCKN